MMAYVAHDAKNRKSVPEYLDNFWFDLLPAQPACAGPSSTTSASTRLVYGDNFPGQRVRSATSTTPPASASSESERDQIRSHNAARLLRLPAASPS